MKGTSNLILLAALCSTPHVVSGFQRQSSTRQAKNPLMHQSDQKRRHSKAFLSVATNGNVVSSSPLKTFFKQAPIPNFNFPRIMNSVDKPSPGAAFLQAVADQDIDLAMQLIANEEGEDDSSVEFFDTEYPSPLNRQELGRMLRLNAQISKKPPTLVIEDDIYDSSTGKAGVTFRLGSTKCAAFFELNDSGLIHKVFYVKENQKQGESNLKILKVASDIIGSTKKISTTTPATKKLAASLGQKSPPEMYFDAWNKRDMQQATSVFSSDIEYDDTAFPKPFIGRKNLENHLNLCADALPGGFSFVLDDKIDVGDKVMVRWHVENEGEELPFTKGCSFYKIEKGKIVKGTDWKEPAVFKTAGLELFARSVVDKVQQEPARLVPIAVWVVYCYVVFFSNWFYGLPAQALEQRTWEEVRDLSLNFFLVSPILGLPFSPVVHPGLEGIFNLLLSWAALFAGFLSDDRERKPNPLPMLPTVIGMQFLTSAFLLPYLATRSTEIERIIKKEELSVVAQATESRLLGPVMGVVGTGAIFWGLYGRMEDFGGFNERLESLVSLLSIDRVGSSFLVDLAVFGLFQGWLVDDDLRRRGVDENDDSWLFKAAKYIPFFGMVAYLTFRPSFTSNGDSDNS
jgi:hypothetical protein